ncbi:MAG: alpha/beta fold hydrolase [Thiolinea sp.]
MQRQRLPGTPEPAHYFQGCEDNTIAGDSWGDPGQTAVILLHGGGQTRHAWKGAGEKLGEAGFYTLSLDLRGHGDSSWINDSVGYTEAKMAADLACVLEQAEIRRPILVGASLGGLTALSAIGQKVVDARALVLVDIVPGFEEAGARRVLQFMAMGQQGFASLEEVSAAIAMYQPQRKAKRNPDGLAKNIRLGDDGRYYWHWDPAFLQRSERDYKTVQAKLHAYAEELTLPTLLVRGGLSDLLTDESTNKFLNACPHAEYTNITDAAHMVAGDRNDIFTEAVVDFLRRL